MPRTSVQTAFTCRHTAEVKVDIDDDVEVPDEVKGLGKCADCMNETNLMAIPGVQPQANGRLLLESIFLMPAE